MCAVMLTFLASGRNCTHQVNRSTELVSFNHMTCATGLSEDGDGKGVAVSVQDALQTLISMEIVLQDLRSAKRRGEARQEAPPKVG